MLPMNTRLRNPRRSLVSSPVSAPVSSYQPFSPLALQPRLWLDAADASTITASSGAVSEWRDKSGNGYAFTQATSTAQPTTGTTTQNGLNVISFDGGDLLASTAASSEWRFLHDGTPYIVASVARRNTSGVNGTIFGTLSGGNTTGGGIRWLANGNTISHFVSAFNASAAPPLNVVNNNIAAGTTTAARVISLLSRPSQSTASERSGLWVDGEFEQNLNTDTNAATTANPSQTAAVGNRLGTALALTGYHRRNRGSHRLCGHP